MTFGLEEVVDEHINEKVGQVMLELGEKPQLESYRLGKNVQVGSRKSGQLRSLFRILGSSNRFYGRKGICAVRTVLNLFSQGQTDQLQNVQNTEI